MRFLRVVALLTLGGCSLIDPHQPAHYLCTADGGSLDSQCPGGWKCGHGGYCIDPEVPDAYACASDDDCIGGWHCGLDSTCLDPQVPRPYRCLADHDCAGQWHCGVSGVCYDATVPAPVECRPLGEDCAPGWRCGLNHLCHDADAGAPYACAADLDCERQWRCGGDAVCLDASRDALRPNAASPVPSATLVSPALLPGLPDQVATYAFGSTVCDAGVSQRSTSLLQGSTLTRLERYRTAAGGLPLNCGSAPPDDATPNSWARLFRTTLSFSVGLQLANDADRTWVIQGDGGLSVVTVDRATGAFTESSRAIPISATGLSLGDSPDYPLVVFGGSWVAIGLADGGWQLPPPLPADAGTVRSALASRQGAGLNEESIKVNLADGTTWGLSWSLPTTLDQLATADWKASGVPDCSWVCSDGQPPQSVVSLPPTPAGSRFLSYCPAPGDGGLGLEVDTVEANCVVSKRVGIASPGYGPLRGSVRQQGAGELCLADDVGGVWSQPSGAFSSEVLSEVPTQLMGSVDAPMVAVPVLPKLPANVAQSSDLVLVAGNTYQLGDAGFTAVSGDPVSGRPLPADSEFIGGVDGQPGWGLFSTSAQPLVVVDPRGSGFAWPTHPSWTLARSSAGLSPPLRAAAPPGAADGGAVVLVSSQDTLFYSTLSPVPASDPEQAPELRLAFVPQARADITALVSTSPEPGASFSSSYLIASGRVYRVRADNPVVWRADEARLQPTEAVSLWKDGERMRVGYSTGAVYGLPSGTQLAPALNGAASIAVDFQNVCGHTLMLSRDGLYQLVNDGTSPVGAWRKVPLSATGALDQPMGRLQSDGRGLLVYRERGVVERLTGLTCLPAE